MVDESAYFDTFRMRSNEVDNQRRIKIPALISCMQEAAWSNAEKLGFSSYELLKRDITWVINRMHIEFFTLPTYPHTLTVETWPSGLDRLFAYRDFRAFNESKELIARATSNWLVLNVKTRKLTPVPDDIKEADFSVDRNEMDKVKDKLHFDVKQTTNEKRISVSWFDLDWNNHVNNTHYFRWVLDALDEDTLACRLLQSLDITFKAEAVSGEDILSQCYAIGKNSFAHQLVNSESGKVLVVAKSVFK